MTYTSARILCGGIIYPCWWTQTTSTIPPLQILMWYIYHQCFYIVQLRHINEQWRGWPCYTLPSMEYYAIFFGYELHHLTTTCIRGLIEYNQTLHISGLSLVNAQSASCTSSTQTSSPSQHSATCSNLSPVRPHMLVTLDRWSYCRDAVCWC